MRIFFCFFVFCGALFAEDYAFLGKHFIASYSGCDQEALCDVDGLRDAMVRAAGKSGAHVLDKCDYVFPGNGMTMVILLSESHASIHTYPEHGACFVDLFTCGDRCSHERFDAVLREYLKPSEVNQKALVRHQGIEDQ